MTKYTYSISTQTQNGAVASEQLKLEIQSSAIVTSLHHIDTGGDVLDIWFNADLSAGDQAILTSIVGDHLGVDLTPKDMKFDEDGRLITSSQPSLLGTGTWLVSDNICSATLPSNDPSWGGNPPSAIGTTHANGGTIVYEWVPTSGKKLYCLETQLIISPDVDLSSVTCHFLGVNAGSSGTQQFDRTYTGEWGRTGYRVQSDEAYQDAHEERFYWRYTVPIILKSSHSSKIVLTRSGNMTGTLAYVKIKVISLNE